MKNQNINSTEAAILRQDAEELHIEKPSGTSLEHPNADVQKLLHELEVHHGELYLHNEELMATLSAAQDAIKLYELAPSGYFTLSCKGEILKLNPCAANMLGKERQSLLGSSFDLFISDDSIPIFRLFLEKTIQSKSIETCDVMLIVDDNSPMYVQLTGIATENKDCLVTVNDITERKLTEKELLESEQSFRAYIENSIDVILTVNKKGEFLFVSGAWEKYFGIPGSDVIGKEFTQFIHSDDIAFCTEYVQRILSTGQGGRSPAYRVKGVNGEWRWCITNGKSYVDPQGNVLFIGVNHDITERINAEEALRKSEERFSLSMDATSDGLWDWDIPSGYLYYSPGYFRMLGYSSNEFENTIDTWKNLLHPDDMDTAIKKNEDCLNNVSQNVDAEFRMKAKDGTWRWILGRGKAVERDANGKALRMIGTHVDITSHKLASQALNESEALYRAIITASPDQIIITDWVGKINMASPATLKLFGYEWSERLKESSITDFLVPEDRELAAYHISLRKQGIKTGPNEYLALRADGSIFYLEVSGEFIQSEEGQPTQMLFIGRDISERKRVELEIKRKNEELSKLNAEKDLFFSIISHDMRSPFNGFLGYTKILAEQLPSMTAEQIQKVATGMNKSANNLFSLLENLLQWARIQQGLIPFKPEPLQMPRIISQNIEMLKQSAISKEIEITNHIQKNTIIFADKNMLQTIIRNLISNALKFTPRGGEICISAKNCTERSIEISIADTGIGMNRTMIENLFRIDVKTGRKGTEDEPSTGLGLILCKEFIDKHDGKIWVESEEGKGSVFYFTIPLNA